MLRTGTVASAPTNRTRVQVSARWHLVMIYGHLMPGLQAEAVAAIDEQLIRS